MPLRAPTPLPVAETYPVAGSTTTLVSKHLQIVLPGPPLIAYPPVRGA